MTDAHDDIERGRELQEQGQAQLALVAEIERIWDESGFEKDKDETPMKELADYLGVSLQDLWNMAGKRAGLLAVN